MALCSVSSYSLVTSSISRSSVSSNGKNSYCSSSRNSTGGSGGMLRSGSAPSCTRRVAAGICSEAAAPCNAWKRPNWPNRQWATLLLPDVICARMSQEWQTKTGLSRLCTMTGAGGKSVCMSSSLQSDCNQCAGTQSPLVRRSARRPHYDTCHVSSSKRIFLQETTHIARRVVSSCQATAADQMAPLAEAEVLKEELYRLLEGENRGIFGISAAKKAQVEQQISKLEAFSPLPNPTENLQQVAGEWRLLYSTISILGSKRTKLGLREFVSLGEFRQVIDVENSLASNIVDFSVKGLGLLEGDLTIKASYTPSSPTRVDIKFESSSLRPKQLQVLFEKNYDLLLAIFNPEGWLEITYVDNKVRVGRDNKGNIFLVERV